MNKRYIGLVVALGILTAGCSVVSGIYLAPSDNPRTDWLGLVRLALLFILVKIALTLDIAEKRPQPVTLKTFLHNPVNLLSVVLTIYVVGVLSTAMTSNAIFCLIAIPIELCLTAAALGQILRAQNRTGAVAKP